MGSVVLDGLELGDVVVNLAGEVPSIHVSGGDEEQSRTEDDTVVSLAEVSHVDDVRAGVDVLVLEHFRVLSEVDLISIIVLEFYAKNLEPL